jgi:hypothetical protein
MLPHALIITLVAFKRRITPTAVAREEIMERERFSREWVNRRGLVAPRKSSGSSPLVDNSSEFDARISLEASVRDRIFFIKL